MGLPQQLKRLDERVLGPPRHRNPETTAAINVLAYALFAVVGAVVALLGHPGYGWSLCALNVFLGAFHGLRYLSLRKGNEEWDDE